jgi:hypothetical protein
MKNILILSILIFCSFIVFSQSQNDTLKHKIIKDTINTTIFSAGFLSSGSGNFIGGNISIDAIIGPAGLYGSFLFPVHKDTVLISNLISVGISMRTVSNFFLYVGASFSKDKPINKNSNIGFDFGAVYYAGIRWARMGLQIGYNTLLETPIIGFRVGISNY